MSVPAVDTTHEEEQTSIVGLDACWRAGKLVNDLRVRFGSGEGQCRQIGIIRSFQK